MAVGLHLLRGMGISAFLFPIASPLRREQLIGSWSRHLLKICGIRLVIRGKLSAAPALIVCNHISWLDIFAINACKPCRFVAKSDVRDWPVIGWLCDRAGTIFIARGRQRDVRRIFQRLVSSIHSGERIAFFPEGTTSAQGKCKASMQTCSRQQSMRVFQYSPKHCVTSIVMVRCTLRRNILATRLSCKACSSYCGIGASSRNYSSFPKFLAPWATVANSQPQRIHRS